MRATLRARDRGITRTGWLESWHSFSFGEYHDPDHMGFGPLRVINEDFVAGGAGFPMHGHRDMEIITYVLSGALEHKDSLGTGSVIRPSEVQMMRAGKGILHSEYNPSETDSVHLLQIWIMPDEKGLPPAYQQKAFADEAFQNRLALIVAPEGEDAQALSIRQDARIYAARLDTGATAETALKPDRKYWLQVARGAVDTGGETLEAGDALSLSGETGTLALKASGKAEILVFDLPP
jgi:quercetin 2,3-dioxygenase